VLCCVVLCFACNVCPNELFSAERMKETQTRFFFIPATIDSDVCDTECIGEHTAVEVGD
jgi:6-phosphofructokinase